MKSFFRRIRKYLTVPLLAYVLLAGAVAYTIDQVQIQAHQRTQEVSVRTTNKLSAEQRLLHRQLVQGCVRLNILRASDNRAHYADYRYASQQYQFSKGSLKANYVALKKLGISKKVLATAVKQAQESLITQKQVITSTTWIPLTDCTAAVAKKGIYYKAPPGISFKKTLPPKTALSVSNAERLDPKGSVR